MEDWALRWLDLEQERLPSDPLASLEFRSMLITGADFLLMCDEGIAFFGGRKLGLLYFIDVVFHALTLSVLMRQIKHPQLIEFV